MEDILILETDLSPDQTNMHDLKRYLPLGQLLHKFVEKAEYYHIDRWMPIGSTDYLGDISARYIRFTAKKHDKIRLYLGKGYVAEKDESWRKPFNRRSGWTGGDGIFSFNIRNGNDAYDQQDAKTIFVFGDTLIGNTDPLTKKRALPVLMPANTIAYLDGNGSSHKDIRFEINTNGENNVIPFFEPDNEFVYEGTTAQNLVRTDHKKKACYLSGYDPQKVELTFDLNINQHISAIDIYNYYPERKVSDTLLNRGIKTFSMNVSMDGDKWLNLGTFELEKAKSENDFKRFKIHKPFRYLKLTVPPKQGEGNHYDKDDDTEVVFGLNRVVFHNEKDTLEDIRVKASSVMSKTKKNAWFWLQDGVVIGRNIYFLPLIITPDTDKPEGLQFSVDSICMIKAPIRKDHVDFEKHIQKPTPLYRTSEESETAFGAAIMPNTKEAGAKHPDGYIYIYGYTTENARRTLKVARVRPEDFEFVDKWRYFSKNGWSSRIEKATPLLSHISCEMSVSPIETGHNKGKYLAVFQYNVNSDYVAYSIGETPYGPFSDPSIVYECEEPKTLKRKTYSYNAKAHPHLSLPGDILVSYNVNSYEMDHHLDNVEVYHPRFIRLKDTSVDHDKEVA